MKALRVHDGLSLFFTTVIDELHLGTDEDDEQEIVDRKYWESRGTKESVKLVDNIFGIIETVAPGYSLKYNKHYIGLSKGGISQNFVSFVPRKKVMLLSVKHEQTEEIEQLISESDFDVLAYDRQWKQYRLRLTKKDIENSKDALVKLIGLAYAAYMS